MPRIESWRLPGIFIRDMLSDGRRWDGLDIATIERLASGRVRASTAEVHRAYRRRIKQENALRPRANRLRGMKYPSMERYFHLFRTLGMIAPVGTKPIDTRLGHLLRFKPGRRATLAVQVVYEVRAPEDDWRWVLPWLAREGRTPTRTVEVPGVATEAPIPAFELPAKPSPAAVKALLDHLREVDPEQPGGKAEFVRLADALDAEWRSSTDKALEKEEEKDDPNEERVERLQQLSEAFEEAENELRKADFLKASVALEGAFPAREPREKKAPKAKAAKVAKPKGTLAQRLEAEAAAFTPRIGELRQTPDLVKLQQLEKDMTLFFEKVNDAQSPKEQVRLDALAERLIASAQGFEAAASALKRLPGPRARREYDAALDKLLTCCPAPA